MFKLLPLLLLAILLSFTGFAAAVKGNTICETTSGSPLTSELMIITHLGPSGAIACHQESDGSNGRPGCTLCGGVFGGSLKISICGVKGSRYSFGQVKQAVANLASDCTRNFGTAQKTGGKWREEKGEFMILIHL
ncbi:uncharacterized protein H6S33_008663 [Morchella sextelata]|jgi:hypothetical protein|uniref:uncharacterized protein n=1 Tax=Morchella sextelata TaxID=1174677 RepID=UPI001D059F7D|nr:uncharacterized protein H6S33_008663 [Morchella sextelata]KAH0602582.1 hypothetical protein H6S33_008663 [Morchella sextelata]